MNLDPVRFFSHLDASQRLVVAVSGGSDSLALLVLVDDFLAGYPSPRPQLLAVTVDHGLRPESGDEAVRVARFCAARSLAHRILVWRGQKPQNGLSAAAREARYGLLARAAADFGAPVILTGHTLDDQAETVAMRASRGDGAGLAGMADATLFEGSVWIVRPLLSLRRQLLRDELSSRGIGWIEDPSNQNPAFERVRVRESLTEAQISLLSAQAQAQAVIRTNLSGTAALLVDHHMSRLAPGLFRLERALFADAHAQGGAGILALRAVLATVGGTARLPDRERTDGLFQRLAAGEMLRATLSRTLVEARPDAVFLHREARNLPQVVTGREPTIWDGRFRISADPGLTIMALGTQLAGARLADRRLASAAPTGGALADTACKGAPARLFRAALAAEPFLAGPGVDQPDPDAPMMASCDYAAPATPLVAPYSRFLPAFDLALAGALGRLVGAPALAASPWKHHNHPNA